jgi:hypothetical protein
MGSLSCTEKGPDALEKFEEVGEAINEESTEERAEKPK